VIARPDTFDAEGAAARLAQAALLAEAEQRLERQRWRRAVVVWSLFAGLCLSPLMLAGLMPERSVELFPKSQKLYRLVGLQVNPVGLEIHDVAPQRKKTQDAVMLAVTGQISNVSGRARKIPPIRFALLDVAGREVFSWSLPETARALKAGDQTGFITRIADPPQTAQSLEIRFARAGEIGSNAAP
jgi:hypothetical protein